MSRPGRAPLPSRSGGHRGKVDGVTNDAEATRTVKVTLKDNGDGTISAPTAPASAAAAGDAGQAPAPLFSFTNTYEATAASEPDGAFVFSKTLDGAELKDGQFTFQLAPPAVGSLAFELAAVVRACGRVGYRSDYVKVKGRFLTSSPFSNAKP